jgi:hypothetical protein
MSDIYSFPPAQPSNIPTPDAPEPIKIPAIKTNDPTAQRAMNIGASGNVDTSTADRAMRMEAPRIAVQDHFGDLEFKLNDQLVETYLDAFFDGQIKGEQEFNKLLVYDLLGQKYGIKSEEAAANLDYYLQDFYRYDPQVKKNDEWDVLKVLKNLENSIAQGHMTARMNVMGLELQQVELLGNAKRVEEINNNIANLEFRAETFWKIDDGPKNPIGNFLYNVGTLTAGNLEFMGGLALATALTGGFIAGAAAVEGNMYREMRKLGATPQSATVGSVFGVGLVSYLENSLGVLLFVKEITRGNPTLLDKAVSVVGERLLVTLAAKGIFTGATGRSVAAAGGLILKEGTEEFWQHLTETGAQHLTAIVQNTLSNEQKMKYPDWKTEVLGAWDDFLAGMMGAVIFGGMQFAGKIKGNYETANKMKEDAQSMPNSEFHKKWDASEILKGTPEQRAATAEQTYQSAQALRAAAEREAKAEAEKNLTKAGSELPDDIDLSPEAPMETDFQTMRSNPDGSVKRVFVMGNPKILQGLEEGQGPEGGQEIVRLGEVQYTQNGNEITITEVKAKADRQGNSRAMAERTYREFTGQLDEDTVIHWEPTAQEQIDLKEAVFQNNPNGTALYRKEEGFKGRILEQFRDRNPIWNNREIADATYDVIQKTIKAMNGIDINTDVDKWFKDINNPISSDIPGNTGLGILPGAAAQQYITPRGTYINGATISQRMTEAAEAVRNIIYLSPNASPLTVGHEAFHGGLAITRGHIY